MRVQRKLGTLNLIHCMRFQHSGSKNILLSERTGLVIFKTFQLHVYKIVHQFIELQRCRKEWIPCQGTLY